MAKRKPKCLKWGKKHGRKKKRCLRRAKKLTKKRAKKKTSSKPAKEKLSSRHTNFSMAMKPADTTDAQLQAKGYTKTYFPSGAYAWRK